MQSHSGFMKMGGAVGIMMFLQHWYWYPLMRFLSLSFTSTMLIGPNKDFDMPTLCATCNAPPSMFSYLLPEEKKDEDVKMVTTVVLSTTMRAKQRRRLPSWSVRTARKE